MTARLCEFCGDKAVGKYFVEQEEDNIGGWVRVCSDHAGWVEGLNYNIEYYKYYKALATLQDLPDCSHRWTKHSLVTEDAGYDWMKCTECGWYGKRYGVGAAGITDIAKIKENFNNSSLER